MMGDGEWTIMGKGTDNSGDNICPQPQIHIFKKGLATVDSNKLISKYMVLLLRSANTHHRASQGITSHSRVLGMSWEIAIDTGKTCGQK